MVRTPGFQCSGHGSILGQGTEILRNVWCSQKKKKKKYQINNLSYHVKKLTDSKLNLKQAEEKNNKDQSKKISETENRITHKKNQRNQKLFLSDNQVGKSLARLIREKRRHKLLTLRMRANTASHSAVVY